MFKKHQTDKIYTQLLVESGEMTTGAEVTAKVDRSQRKPYSEKSYSNTYTSPSIKRCV